MIYYLFDLWSMSHVYDTIYLYNKYPTVETYIWTKSGKDQRNARRPLQ